MCFQLHKLDFHKWKVEPSNSLTKSAASFHQIGRRIRYVDVFEFPKNRESVTGIKFTFIIAFYLLRQAKSIKSSDIMSEHIAILVGYLQHFGQTMPDVGQ